MKVITLLTDGHIGGIETLCLDYATYSAHDNVMLMLFGGGGIADEMKAKGIRVIVLNASRRDVPGTVRRVMDVIREEQADVLIAQHEASMSHLCLMRAKKLFPNLHTIAYAQLNAVDMIRADEKKGLWLRKAIIGRSLKRADDVVAISQSVRQSLLDVMHTPADKISIIYNAVNLEGFPYRDREYSPEVCELIYVGRLIEAKGVQITLRALGQVRDKNRFRLRIAGDGDYREELVRLAEELDISDRVEFLGSRRDVPDLLNSADVFIHMPVWAEGFGIAVAEAMSAGCICVCAANGAMPELIDDRENGFLIGREDASHLARTLDEIYLMSADEKRHYAQAAHEKAKQFSTEIFVRKLDALASGHPERLNSPE